MQTLGSLLLIALGAGGVALVIWGLLVMFGAAPPLKLA